MPEIANLPLFPLSLVLHPEEQVPLHIFEERYKEMVQYCTENDSPFGILHAEDEDVAEVGCTARIDRILQRYEDGRMDILVVGEERFRIRQIHREKAYLSADVEIMEEEQDRTEADVRERAITQHMRLLELVGEQVRPSLYENVERLSFVISPRAGLEPEQKQRLLEMNTEGERLDFLVNHMEQLIPRVERMEKVRRKVQSNGHFPDSPPENL